MIILDTALFSGLYLSIQEQDGLQGIQISNKPRIYQLLLTVISCTYGMVGVVRGFFVARHLPWALKDNTLSYSSYSFLCSAKKDLPTRKCISGSETEAADLQMAEWSCQAV